MMRRASLDALGEAYRHHFETRGSLEDVNLDELRERYREYVEKGREIARNLREAARFDEDEPMEDPAEALDRLTRLRRVGVLTEEEFERLTQPPLRLGATVEEGEFTIGRATR